MNFICDDGAGSKQIGGRGGFQFSDDCPGGYTSVTTLTGGYCGMGSISLTCGSTGRNSVFGGNILIFPWESFTSTTVDCFPGVLVGWEDVVIDADCGGEAIGSLKFLCGGKVYKTINCCTYYTALINYYNMFDYVLTYAVNPSLPANITGICLLRHDLLIT